VIVIQKPPPATPAVVEIKPERAPEPPQKPPPEPVQQVAKKVTREPPVASRPQPSADAPPLVPASSSQQQGTIQRHVRTLQHNIEVRIGRLARLSLGGADRKTLDDARTFVAESESAIERGDLAQASNLAQKADLLVLAVEKRR
jgi:outer membrane biosynthesis protein TonB